ncbi:MAG TPA: FAD-binding oxidoreductase [Microlunatus sp.]|nr:FAD-binding oxidoreductase [Microlunatus sp.]
MTALHPAGRWCSGRVVAVEHPNPRAVVLRLEVPDRMEHVPGQHYVIRLRAEDGYTAARSYSLASAPHEPYLEFYVEEIADGEVSPYLADAVEVGDELELRGPIGGWFVWDGRTPAVGVAGGTGVVPLVAMLRHARHLGTEHLLHLAVSSRTLAELPYADELSAARVTVALSRERTLAGRPAGRLTAAEVAPYVDPAATFFVCGSAGFAEAASDLLVELGLPPGSIRVERFGPSG